MSCKVVYIEALFNLGYQNTLSLNNQNLKGKKTTFNMLLSAFTEMKGKFNLENVAKEFSYTKELMGLCRQPNVDCNWKEFDQGKTVQEENIKEILDSIDANCVAVFTDGSALGNPGPTGAGAAIYHNGLDEDPICISKPVCSNGNNYIGELIGRHVKCNGSPVSLTEKCTVFHKTDF